MPFYIAENNDSTYDSQIKPCALYPYIEVIRIEMKSVYSSQERENEKPYILH
jgi:hypothetical protein